MPAVDSSEITRFGLVGIAATVLYATLALALTHWFFASVPASLIAYAAAATFSYLAHKSITFFSTGAHRLEAPRFVVLTAVGIAIAFAAPLILTDMLALRPIFAVLLTCLLVPVVNFVVMDRWVFAGRKSAR
jgi:putative flippase GtrA